MDHLKKTVGYTTVNSYETLNRLSAKTTHIWVVFHGIGYLSRYFLKYFKTLDPETNYVVAPQAPAKYYLNDSYRYVGASWLTKEDTHQEITNVNRYLDAVFENEQWPANARLVVFGFSQGVSIALRWLAHRQLSVKQLVLYAGGIPRELKAEDLAFLRGTSVVKVIYGSQDPYLTPDRLLEQGERVTELFGETAQLIEFEGGHEVKIELVQQLVTTDRDRNDV